MIDVVCGLIEDGNGRLLACRRPPEKHLGGLWEFPGGKVELGESPEAALVRELREELGIETEITGALHPHEHDALEWIDVATCDRLYWAAADGPILAEWKAGGVATNRNAAP
jgi:8-oxo-dGTP diphosphatase